jgi:hypothetical protein
VKFELEMSNNDIILVSETHLSRDIDNEDIQLRGFQNPIRVEVCPIQYLDQGLIQYVLVIECSTVQFVNSASYFDNKRDF